MRVREAPRAVERLIEDEEQPERHEVGRAGRNSLRGSHNPGLVPSGVTSGPDPGNQNGESISIIEETLGGLRVIKAFNVESLLRNKFLHTNNDLLEARNKIGFRRDLASPLSEMMGVAIFAGILLKISSYPTRNPPRNTVLSFPNTDLANRGVYAKPRTGAKLFLSGFTPDSEIAEGACVKKKEAGPLLVVSMARTLLLPNRTGPTPGMKLVAWLRTW